jgi:hypothetical protein
MLPFATHQLLSLGELAYVEYCFSLKTEMCQFQCSPCGCDVLRRDLRGTSALFRPLRRAYQHGRIKRRVPEQLDNVHEGPGHMATPVQGQQWHYELDKYPVKSVPM